MVQASANPQAGSWVPVVSGRHIRFKLRSFAARPEADPQAELARGLEGRSGGHAPSPRAWTQAREALLQMHALGAVHGDRDREPQNVTYGQGSGRWGSIRGASADRRVTGDPPCSTRERDLQPGQRPPLQALLLRLQPRPHERGAGAPRVRGGARQRAGILGRASYCINDRCRGPPAINNIDAAGRRPSM
jgi:hypothetical protein